MYEQHDQRLVDVGDTCEVMRLLTCVVEHDMRHQLDHHVQGMWSRAGGGVGKKNKKKGGVAVSVW